MIPDRQLELSPESLRRFCQLITRQLGIKMSEAKLPMIQSRLQRRLRALGLASLEDYQRHLFNAFDAEFVNFVDAITTNKTDFFREDGHFDYLARTLLPALDPGTSAWTLRAWSAGCSTGEEVYTLAMILTEFGRQRPGFDFFILGTDISTRALAQARLAIYEKARIAPVPPTFVQHYFLHHRDLAHAEVRVVPELRAKTEFHRLNFMDEHYRLPCSFDIIFFRNVMIYFDQPTQEAVVNRIVRHLLPGGHLFVGHAESLASLRTPLMTVASAVHRRVEAA